MTAVYHQHRFLRFPARETFRAVGVVLKSEMDAKYKVSVVFTDDRLIKRMNRKYLSHNRVTDVIAFELQDGIGMDGELYVNLDQARRQATEFGVPFREEVRRLLIHGTLHLAGYRDSTKQLKQKMHRLEDRYLERLRRTR